MRVRRANLEAESVPRLPKHAGDRTEYAGRGAGRANSRTRARVHTFRISTDLGEDRSCEFEPADRSGIRGMKNERRGRCRGELEKSVGEVGCVRR